MLIFPDARLVFLATPKAGSTAVEVALESLAGLAVERPPALKHTSAAAFERHVRPWLEGAFPGGPFATVALMREPIDWLRSWYRFVLRDQEHGDDDDEEAGGDAPATAFPDFAAFATSAVGADPPPPARIGSQSAFLTGDGARVERIFRYEAIEDFTRYLEERLDCVVSLPRVNVPPSRDTTLDPETEATLRQALAAEFALYDAL